MSESTREPGLIAAFVRLADTLTAEYDSAELLHTLLQECTDLLDRQGGGLLVADSSGDLHLTASTSEKAQFVEIMQLNAEVGPCVECFKTGQVVSVPDLGDLGTKWSEFRAAALRQGFHSVYAVPLRLRKQVIGAMNLFGTGVGTLNERDASVAQALADVATIGIIQERTISEAGLVAEQLQHALDSRTLIEQAKGILANAGSIEIDEAFAALRTFARNNNLSLRTVAEGVISQTIDVFADAPIP